MERQPTLNMRHGFISLIQSTQHRQLQNDNEVHRNETEKNNRKMKDSKPTRLMYVVPARRSFLNISSEALDCSVNQDDENCDNRDERSKDTSDVDLSLYPEPSRQNIIQLSIDLSILTPEEIEDAVTVLLHEIDGVSGTQGQQSASRILSFAYQHSSNSDTNAISNSTLVLTAVLRKHLNKVISAGEKDNWISMLTFLKLCCLQLHSMDVEVVGLIQLFFEALTVTTQAVTDGFVNFATLLSDTMIDAGATMDKVDSWAMSRLMTLIRTCFLIGKVTESVRLKLLKIIELYASGWADEYYDDPSVRCQ